MPCPVLPYIHGVGLCCMSFQTISAILRGRWLIDRSWVQANMPLILNVIQGKQANFQRTGFISAERPFIVDPQTMVRYEWAIFDYNSERWVPNSNVPQKSVAVIPITGPILKYNGDCGEPGSVQRIGWVQEVDQRDYLAGAMYIIDSPGGQAEGTASLSAAIKNAKKRSVSYVDDGIAASAAMWLGASSDEFYASMATDMVGSIGVYAQLFDFRGYLEQQGIKMHEIYAPQSTDKNEDYRQALDGNYQLVEEELKVVANEFINSIDKNRGGKASASKNEWSTGKMFYAKDAIKLGLLDGIKPMQEALLRVLTVNRGNKLIVQTKSTKNMAFEKTLATAKAQSFAVVEGGFLLTEEQLNSLETHITSQETALQTAQQETVTANARITELTTTAAADKEKITGLEQQVTNLKKGDAGQFTKASADGDDKFESGKDKYADLRKEAFPGRY